MPSLAAGRKSFLQGIIDHINNTTGTPTMEFYDDSSPPVLLFTFNLPRPTIGSITDENTYWRAEFIIPSPNTITATYSGSTATLGEVRLKDGAGTLLCTCNIAQDDSEEFQVANLVVENGFEYFLQQQRISRAQAG